MDSHPIQIIVRKWYGFKYSLKYLNADAFALLTDPLIHLIPVRYDWHANYVWNSIYYWIYVHKKTYRYIIEYVHNESSANTILLYELSINYAFLQINCVVLFNFYPIIYAFGICARMNIRYLSWRFVKLLIKRKLIYILQSIWSYLPREKWLVRVCDLCVHRENKWRPVRVGLLRPINGTGAAWNPDRDSWTEIKDSDDENRLNDDLEIL